MDQMSDHKDVNNKLEVKIQNDEHINKIGYSCKKLKFLFRIFLIVTITK